MSCAGSSTQGHQQGSTARHGGTRRLAARWGAARRDLRPGATLVAAALLTLAGAPSAVAQAAGEGAPGESERMQEELRRQQQLLDRLQKGESLEGTGLEDLEPEADTGGSGGRDPRSAPAAPEERDLPLAIFERETVRVEAGRWGQPRSLRLERRVLDADGDDHAELVRWVDPNSGWLVRQHQDRNYDGVTDAWSDYEHGRLVARTLDSNDDGNPDTWERYEEGRMVRREVDRDDDGVRDAFYRYEGATLAEERHDTDNDGRVDLRVAYEDGHRARAEEDRDHDGRMDLWRFYELVDGRELVTRIERDEEGRGFADTFDTYEARDGRAVLARRERDVDGDGEVDVTSYYRDGKLVRREILDPDLLPL